MRTRTMTALLMMAACLASIPALAQDRKSARDPANRQVFFGEQHLHTDASADAYIQGNHKNTIEDAFKYIKGLPVKKYLTGETVQRKTPYDWTAVTDHAEYLGLPNRLGEDPPPVSPDDPIVKALKSGDPKQMDNGFRMLAGYFTKNIREQGRSSLELGASQGGDEQTLRARKVHHADRNPGAAKRNHSE